MGIKRKMKTKKRINMRARENGTALWMAEDGKERVVRGRERWRHKETSRSKRV